MEAPPTYFDPYASVYAMAAGQPSVMSVGMHAVPAPMRPAPPIHGLVMSSANDYRVLEHLIVLERERQRLETIFEQREREKGHV